ncbi:MAG: tRNA (adenosine(37)-N6)-threonylcarbamoyltransferase complex transferase subunit TsaD [Acidobacteria bacterium]|nr:tRNA (adenosine(37)-N6)-threonylcarbamoyltransferase complex transferase subunit TsaD [Acidobacteriota bacterium]
MAQLQSSARDQRPVVILGIESSCDETAAAVVEDGARVRSSVVASQMATHGKFEGIVPELASREHLRNIVPVVREAMEKAELKYSEMDAIAVTHGPGLAGALLVGLTYAKSLALALDKPLIAVNHLEGHIHAVLLEERLQGRAEPELPALSLVVSGGHTMLVVSEERERLCEGSEAGEVAGEDALVLRHRIIGRTRDDAAGEAFDKVAKLLGFGYPGGPVIDKLARLGNPRAVEFTRPRMKGNALDFSFSGIKTAVLRYVQSGGMPSGSDINAEIEARRLLRSESLRQHLDMTPVELFDKMLATCSTQTLDLIASFQRAVVDDLVEHCHEAAEQEGINSVFLTGGVAANSELRERFASFGERIAPTYFPRLNLSTDNAAMIAAAAYPKFLARDFAGFEVAADPTLALGG